MFLLKPPPAPAPLEFKIFIPELSPARKITITLDSAIIHEQSFPTSGPYTVTTKPVSGSAVTLTFDKTFSVAWRSPGSRCDPQRRRLPIGAKPVCLSGKFFPLAPGPR